MAFKSKMVILALFPAFLNVVYFCTNNRYNNARKNKEKRIAKSVVS
jgi:hypothetical protein